MASWKNREVTLPGVAGGRLGRGGRSAHGATVIRTSTNLSPDSMVLRRTLKLGSLTARRMRQSHHRRHGSSRYPGIFSIGHGGTYWMTQIGTRGMHIYMCMNCVTALNKEPRLLGSSWRCACRGRQERVGDCASRGRGRWAAPGSPASPASARPHGSADDMVRNEPPETAVSGQNQTQSFKCIRKRNLTATHILEAGWSIMPCHVRT